MEAGWQCLPYWANIATSVCQLVRVLPPSKLRPASADAMQQHQHQHQESAEPIQNSERHELVIGERVGGPPLVTAAVHSHEEPTPAAEVELLKVEPVAHGVVHTGVAQALVEAVSVTAASVEASPVARSQRIRNEDLGTETARRTRRRAAPVAMQPGTRVCSNFTHEGRSQWFIGVILEQGSRQVRGSDGVLRWVPAAKGWTVKFFHDGEECAVQEHSLKHEEDIAVAERLGLSGMDAIQNSEGHELVMPPAMPAGAGAKEEEAPPAMPAGAVVKEEVPTAVAITRDTELPGPRPGPHIKVEYEEHSCRVKDEHEQQAASGILRQKDTETLKREAQRRKLQVEPDGKTPRAVFRAGCHRHCLTQVLGGVGTDDERFVREDKVTPDGHVLIREGEMYLWGRADWNTYAPSFAGDVGAYNDNLSVHLLEQQECMGWEKPQETFHLFRECTHRFLIDFPLSAYHGKGAKKKTLYCGKYRVDHDLTYQQSFNEMPECTKACFCELQARRELGSGSSQLERRANEIMSQREEKNEAFTMCSVEFVEYDEKLYRALVASGASNGRVEVDDAELGPL